MDAKAAALEQAIKDCGLPGRLVELDKNLVVVDLLNDRTERLERHELGLSEFCDMLLDWRQKLISRADVSGTQRMPRKRRAARPARESQPDLSVETAA
ncbi:MAG: hypothetical protein WAT58_03270 [Candidatus Dormiibacterota bacterium]